MPLPSNGRHRLRVLISGGVNADRYAEVCNISRRPEAVVLQRGLQEVIIRHQGPGTIQSGEKRNAIQRIPPQIAPLDLPPARLAGAAINTAKSLMQCAAHSVEVLVAHDVKRGNQLPWLLDQSGLSGVCVGNAELAENLIIPVEENASGWNRVILRDPIRQPLLDLQLPGSLVEHLGQGILVINSVKSLPLLRALVVAAEQRGATQITALTGSPCVSAELATARQRNNRMTFGNWSDWQRSLPGMNGWRSLTENTVPAIVLSRLPALAWTAGIQGDIVCTLGHRGIVAGAHRNGRVWWIRLNEQQAEVVRQRIHRAGGGCVNGMGDGLLGCLTAILFSRQVKSNEFGSELPAALMFAWEDLLQQRDLARGSLDFGVSELSGHSRSSLR